MSDTPKFTVVDRRKFKAEEEHEAEQVSQPEPETPAAPSAVSAAGPRLVDTPPAPGADGAVDGEAEEDLLAEMPEPHTAAETSEQKTAYDASAERMEDLLRAQNPSMGAPPPVTFESLVQQFYYSAMVQLGAGTQAGQPARVDVIGARQTIDLLGILAEKTNGNLTEAEERLLQTVLYEARMAFLEVTRMITIQAPPKGAR